MITLRQPLVQPSVLPPLNARLINWEMRIRSSSSYVPSSYHRRSSLGWFVAREQHPKQFSSSTDRTTIWVESWRLQSVQSSRAVPSGRALVALGVPLLLKFPHTVYIAKSDLHQKSSTTWLPITIAMVCPRVTPWIWTVQVAKMQFDTGEILHPVHVNFNISAELNRIE